MGKDSHFPKAASFTIRPFPLLGAATESATSAFVHTSDHAAVFEDDKNERLRHKSFIVIYVHKAFKNSLNICLQGKLKS